MREQEKMSRRIKKSRAAYDRYQTTSKRKDGTMLASKYLPLNAALEDYGRMSFLSGYLRAIEDVAKIYNEKE